MQESSFLFINCVEKMQRSQVYDVNNLLIFQYNYANWYTEWGQLLPIESLYE